MRQAKCSLSHCQEAWTHTAVHLNIMLAHPHCITTFQSCLERKKPWEPFYFFLVWHQKGDYGGDGECRNHLYDYRGKSVITEEKYPIVSELEVTQCGSWTCCQAIQRAGARRATPWCAQTSHKECSCPKALHAPSHHRETSTQALRGLGNRIQGSAKWH